MVFAELVTAWQHRQTVWGWPANFRGTWLHWRKDGLDRMLPVLPALPPGLAWTWTSFVLVMPLTTSVCCRCASCPRSGWPRTAWPARTACGSCRTRPPRSAPLRYSPTTFLCDLCSHADPLAVTPLHLVPIRSRLQSYGQLLPWPSPAQLGLLRMDSAASAGACTRIQPSKS